MAFVDYYELLNITRDAKPQAIRNAFQKLALANHPNKNHSKDAYETFLKLNEAYSILSNPQKRKEYNSLMDALSHTQETADDLEKFRNWQQSIQETNEKSLQKAEAYAQDFKFFSKKVLKKVGLEILLGTVALFFGEIYGIFGAVILCISGLILSIIYWNSELILIGIMVMVFGGFLIRFFYNDLQNKED